ncbi:MFS transporter [Mycobacterium sp. BMJ-28]
MSTTDESTPWAGHAAASSTPEPTGPEPHPVFVIGCVLATLGVWVATLTPNVMTLALRVAQVVPHNTTTAYSTIAAAGAALSLPAGPVFGSLSDRTKRTRLGRRPWLMLSTAGLAGGSVMIAELNSITGLFTGWAVVSIASAIGLSSLWAMITDYIPPSRQGFVSGLAGMAQGAGLLIGAFLAQLTTSMTAMLLIPAALGCTLLLCFALTPHGRPTSTTSRTATSFASSLYFNPRTSPQFAWCLLVLFSAYLGTAVVGAYTVYFMEHMLRIAPAAMPVLIFKVMLVVNLIAVLSSPLAGKLSDRLGRRKPVFAAGSLMVGAGIAVMDIFVTLPGFFTGAVIFGVGYGFILGQTIALASATMTDPVNSARDLGLVTLTQSLPVTIVPIVAPLLLGIGGGDNYHALYTIGIVGAVLAVFFIRKIRPDC